MDLNKKILKEKRKTTLQKDKELNEIKSVIDKTDEKNVDKIDWTKVWRKKYPILTTYQTIVDVESYAKNIRELLDKLKDDYGFSELDAMLVLKDILAHEYRK